MPCAPTMTNFAVCNKCNRKLSRNDTMEHWLCCKSSKFDDSPSEERMVNLIQKLIITNYDELMVEKLDKDNYAAQKSQEDSIDYYITDDESPGDYLSDDKMSDGYLTNNEADFTA